MKSIFTVGIVFLVCSSEFASACGGGSNSRSGRGVSPGNLLSGSLVYPISGAIAMQGAQFNKSRQADAARAAAYHAKMRPIRLANASRVRAEKIARRAARTEFRLAKLEAAKKKQQEFLAKARTWTDSTGSHKVLAVLVDATDVAVKLCKQDGDVIAVPLDRLSSPDQSWVASAVRPQAAENAVMLVSR